MLTTKQANERHTADKLLDRIERGYDSRALTARCKVRDRLVEVRDEARPGCAKCHGTGRLGFLDGDRGRPLVCRCRLVMAQREGSAGTYETRDAVVGRGDVEIESRSRVRRVAAQRGGAAVLDDEDDARSGSKDDEAGEEE